jgi:hypothetical protein
MMKLSQMPEFFIVKSTWKKSMSIPDQLITACAGSIRYAQRAAENRNILEQ